MDESCRSGASAITERIITYITDEGLGVGDRLPSIREMAEKWGVGKFVVREGLLQAQTVGLVKVYPRSNAVVQSLDFSVLVDALSGAFGSALVQRTNNVCEVQYARHLIECDLAAEAALNRRAKDLAHLRELLDVAAASVSNRATFVDADERFHLKIAEIADNRILLLVLQALLKLIRPQKIHGTLSERVGDVDHTLETHRNIYLAILDGDAEAARKAMDIHLARSLGWLRDVKPYMAMKEEHQGTEN
jgi:DNA-binding FadR family transcriptional regulator